MRLGKNTVQVSLRIPEEVHKRLQELAQETDRSMLGYIRWVLNEHLWKLEREKKDRKSVV